MPLCDVCAKLNFGQGPYEPKFKKLRYRVLWTDTLEVKCSTSKTASLGLPPPGFLSLCHWRQYVFTMTFCPSIPFLWMWYFKYTIRDFFSFKLAQWFNWTFLVVRSQDHCDLTFVPYLWPQYLRNTLILCHKCQCGANEKITHFCCQRSMSFWPIKHNFSHDSWIHAIYMQKFQTIV